MRPAEFYKFLQKEDLSVLELTDEDAVGALAHYEKNLGVLVKLLNDSTLINNPEAHPPKALAGASNMLGVSMYEFAKSASVMEASRQMLATVLRLVRLEMKHGSEDADLLAQEAKLIRVIERITMFMTRLRNVQDRIVALKFC